MSFSDVASQSGDALLVSLCLVAMGFGLDMGHLETDTRIESQRRALEKIGVVPESVGADVRARELCAEAILGIIAGLRAGEGHET